MRARLRFTIVVAVASIALSGCAYKPLKAPCSPDEGAPALAYAEPAPRASEAFRSLDRCGPMKPI